ncbi:MAG: phenylalanine--tRNA ligase subunit beta [Pseudomonadota bacterium]
MKISLSWLREWVPDAPDAQELAERLTLAGLEVDSVTTIGEGMDSFFVAEVLAVEPHPNADRLRVCQVSVADGQPLQIVCGAPNARAGMRSILATTGAVMPNGMKIRRSKLRGVESQGMLCSASELGLGDDHDGIVDLPADAPVGSDAAEYLNLPDVVIDIDITPNRGDCFSVLGVAREVAAFSGYRLAEPALAEPIPASSATMAVELQESDACTRFASRLVEGVDPSAETPRWMAERLQRAGLRSINPVVDVTNYVMLELGQPLHAYDADKISGSLVVRRATPGEPLVLLDEKAVELTDDIVVVADQSGALGMAGVMGGLSTMVTDATTRVLFEAAFWTPEWIAGRARRFGLHTDAATRFERGVDPAGQARAVQRATELLLSIAGGTTGPLQDEVHASHTTSRAPIELPWQRIEQLLGIAIDNDVVVGLLDRLGLDSEARSDGVLVTPPTYRFDLAIAEDLVEEVARVYGYDEIPAATALLEAPLKVASESATPLDRLRDLLVARGFYEVLTYSFVNPELALLCDGQSTELALSNPISADLAVMRRSLLPGLLTAAAANRARQHERLRLFEIGTCFEAGTDSAVETVRVGGFMSGRRSLEGWTEAAEVVDFFDIKSVVNALVGRRAGELEWTTSAHPAFHPGQSADVQLGGHSVGRVGRLHPRVANKLDLDHGSYFFELAAALVSKVPLPESTPVSRYPSVRRDIAILVGEDVAAATVMAIIRRAIPARLRHVVLFDVYRGKGVEPGLKSLAFGLILQETSRTLIDEEADSAVRAATDALSDQLGATLRDK